MRNKYALDFICTYSSTYKPFRGRKAKTFGEEPYTLSDLRESFEEQVYVLFSKIS